MIYRVLLSLVFLIASTANYATRVNAQSNGSEPILNASVLSNCDFFNALDGELAVNDGGTILSSVDGGIPATVEIDCNGAATLSISKPQQDSGSTIISDLSATATSTELDIDINSDNTTANNTIAAESSGKITVNMIADNKGQKIDSGEYSFTVILTATP